MKAPIAMKHMGVIGIIMALFLAGCAPSMQTLVYDKPIPDNQFAVLIIPPAYTVTNFDGQNVRWTPKYEFFAVAGYVAAIKLPAGKHNIAYSYSHYDPGMTMTEHYASGAIVQKRMFASTTSFDGNITVNMEAGKKYIFEGRGIVVDTTYDNVP